MLLQPLIGLLSKELFDILSILLALDSISESLNPLLLVLFRMLTGQDVVMTESQLEVSQCSSDLILFLGVQENKPLSQDPAQRLNISHLQMLLLKLSG